MVMVAGWAGLGRLGIRRKKVSTEVQKSSAGRPLWSEWSHSHLSRGLPAFGGRGRRHGWNCPEPGSAEKKPSRPTPPPPHTPHPRPHPPPARHRDSWPGAQTHAFIGRVVGRVMEHVVRNDLLVPRLEHVPDNEV